MVRQKRAFLALAVLLIASTGIAGCLDTVVFDPDCAPTAVAATWTQPGVWDAFPDEGEHGPYNVSVQEPQGHMIVDPDWGELVAYRIERTLERDEENLSLVYRFDHKDTLRVVAPEDLDEDTVEEGFLEVLQAVSPMEERDLRPMIHELLQKDGRSIQEDPSESRGGPQTSDIAPDNDSVKYTLTVSGPLRFGELYQDLLARNTMESRDHPWLEGTVTLEDWTFEVPAPVAVANHTEETGRFLRVDGRDHMEFHWDPPIGVGNDALEAGITRTLGDLGLEVPEDFNEIEVYTVTC